MPGLKGKTALVTGGAGFIGSHLCERLLKEGTDVHVLDKTGGCDSITIHGATYHNADICDPKAVRDVVAAVGPDVAYHLAAYINPDRSPDVMRQSMDVNFYGAMNLMEALRGTDVISIVCASTSDVYGSNKPPFKEDQAVDPISPYSVSKAASEALLRNYMKTFGMPVVIVRPVLTYGPRQRTSFMIPHAIVSALTGSEFRSTKGEQLRAVNFVGDTVDGLVRASCAPGAAGETINLGTERKFAVADIVSRIFEIAGSKIRPGIGELPYRPNEIWDASCDSSKARRILEWEPKTGLEDGLRITIDWYRKNLR